jgi:AmiR/NasT family two-component response regulator
VTGTLDALKVADTVLFVISARHRDGIDEIGEKILTSCMAQGLPSTIVAVTDLMNHSLLVRIIESSCLTYAVNPLLRR